jgi:hypothetical protein
LSKAHTHSFYLYCFAGTIDYRTKGKKTGIDKKHAFAMFINDSRHKLIKNNQIDKPFIISA